MNKQIITFINTLKNISISSKKEVLVPYNSLILNYTDCLYQEGFLQSYEILSDLNKIKIYTRSVNGKVLTSNIKFVSTLTKKRYLSSSLIKQIKVKNKEYILSTNIGILSLSECQRQNVGGLVVFSC
jgi:ribosomal protein S8